MSFSNDVLSVLVIVALALAGLAVAYLLFQVGRGRARARTGKAPSALPEDQRMEVVAQAQAKAIARLEDAVRKLAANERHLAEMFEDAVRHVAVVRFDAFEDMGGRLSFSAALLDDHGDGVVITSINGRQDTRCYAKRVERGTSIHNLSDEEEQAIKEALSGSSQATTVEAR
jgi:hypothetical protein